MGCHLIGAFNILSQQKAEAVFAHAATLHHRTDCEDNALALIRYGGNQIGQVEASWTQKGGMAVLLEVWGDEGMVTYDRSGLSQPIKYFPTGKPTGISARRWSTSRDGCSHGPGILALRLL